ncbi:eukaryotic initiation factor 3 family member related protein [Cyclospora cayetanensis]|uniref:tRNA (adenine(58)-N(1))-methyltransferase non-catalytic subunit TRM6 n=1 Tax=Cyclospora cayetanensis TaxID=88456 RepID=A0A1D3D597_9EIME|nr:eukaryotic initiation factor 3 family member related protein [Cyclospora cayetanensis]
MGLASGGTHENRSKHLWKPLQERRLVHWLCVLRAGTSAAEVIREVAANSTTFEQRTKMSKEKYIKQFTVLEASLSELCQYYFETNPTKIIGLRHDYLSRILHCLSLEPGQRLMVLDHALGLPTAGALMRLGDAGRVFRLLEGGTVGDKALRDAELPASLLASLVDVNIDHLLEILQDRHDGVLHEELKQQGDSTMTQYELFARLVHRALLVAFRYLKPGGRLVLFTQAFEFAGCVHSALCASRDFVHISLEELLLREFQVVPGRTHPIMQSTIAIPSGFIVSATKISTAGS